MTTLLQLLSNYYKAKIDSERIYNEYVQSQYEFASLGKMNSNKDDLLSKKVVDEALFLQRQIAQLNKQLQLSFQENEKLFNVQKNQKALYQSKLTNKDALINDLKLKLKVEQISINKNDSENTPTAFNNQLHGVKAAHISKPTIHLLSPIVNRDEIKNQSKDRNNEPDSPISKRKSKGLRSLLSSGKNTIFDSISKNLDDEIIENGPIRCDNTSSKTADNSTSVSPLPRKPLEHRHEKNKIALKDYIFGTNVDQNILPPRKLDNIELSSLGDSTTVTSRSSSSNMNDTLGYEEQDHRITKQKKISTLSNSPVKNVTNAKKKRKLTRQRITTLPNSDEELNDLNIDEFV
ncbi:lrs4p [Saccharomyces arboricola H-6]|uniref:Lrs4p n=1 Tax=Saccharomyces arboricola (strain H-6 / AS 2.3317 / CBS 10644) TaxID=1160507 RepID=J8Q3I6_SACAR|nr:lrs4p [Saccharomyces arboricola H-6]